MNCRIALHFLSKSLNKMKNIADTRNGDFFFEQRRIEAHALLSVCLYLIPGSHKPRLNQQKYILIAKSYALCPTS